MDQIDTRELYNYLTHYYNVSYLLRFL